MLMEAQTQAQIQAQSQNQTQAQVIFSCVFPQKWNFAGQNGCFMHMRRKRPSGHKIVFAELIAPKRSRHRVPRLISDKNHPFPRRSETIVF